MGKLTLIDWDDSQLPGFVAIEMDKWDDFRLQRTSSLLISLFLMTRRKEENHKDKISIYLLLYNWARNRLASKEKKSQA